MSDPDQHNVAPPALFARVACAVDGSPEALEAARQAVRLAPHDAPIALLSAPVATVIESVAAGSAIPPPPPDHQAEGHERLEHAVRALGQAPGMKTRLLTGPVIPALLEALAVERATLVAAGSHGHRRSTGIISGSVATALLHDAPCSVLLSRPSAEPERFPNAIAVGFDGSINSERALGVARELAGRLAVPLRVVIAGGGKQGAAAVEQAVGAGLTANDIQEDGRSPVDALARVEADLLVVGSRGLHGLRALGSISERVAHRARCSVLVVRTEQS